MRINTVALLIIAACLTGFMCARAAENLELDPKARAQAAFTVAWRVSHDTKSDPAVAAAQIYADGWPGPIMWANTVLPPKTQIPNDASAEDIIAGKHGAVSTEQLWIMAQNLCMEYFAAHLDEFQKLLVRGIAGSRDAQTKAGTMLSEFRRFIYKRADWKQGRVTLKEDDARILNAMSKRLIGPAKIRAAESETLQSGDPIVGILRDIDNPSAIQVLIEKGGDNLPLFEAMRVLQHNRPAEVALVAKLTDASAGARWRAVYALAECGDASLVERLPTLLSDSDGRVRSEALSLAGNLQPKFTPEVDAAVKALLKDPEIEVRKACIRVLTFRADAACAPALLQLLRDGLKHLGELKQYTNQELMEYNVLVEDMERLTGSRYGYDVSAWPADTAANKAALEKFAEWIANNGRK